MLIDYGNIISQCFYDSRYYASNLIGSTTGRANRGLRGFCTLQTALSTAVIRCMNRMLIVHGIICTDN